MIDRNSKKILIFLGIFFLIFTGCDRRYLAEKLLWKADKKTKELIGKKGKNLTDKDIEKIISFYQEVVEKCPLEIPSAKAHFAITQLYILKKEYPKAKEELKEIINNFSPYPKIASQAYLLLGKVWEKEGKIKEAYREYEEAMEKYPLTKIGLLLPIYMVKHTQNFSTKERLFKKGLRHYNKLIDEFSGTKVELLLKDHLALLYMAENKLDKSIEIYKGMLKDSKDERICFKLATLYFYNQQFKEAERIYLELLEKSAGEKKMLIYDALIKCYKKQGEKGKVIKTYQRLREEFPQKSLAVPYLIARYCEEIKDENKERFYDQAIDYYTKIVHSEEKTKRKENALNYLVLCYLGRKDFDKAILFLKELITYFPLNPFYSLRLADLYRSLDRKEEAITLYKEVGEKFKKNKWIVALCEKKINELQAVVGKKPKK